MTAAAIPDDDRTPDPREEPQAFDLSRWRELQALEYPNLLDFDAQGDRDDER